MLPVGVQDRKRFLADQLCYFQIIIEKQSIILFSFYVEKQCNKFILLLLTICRWGCFKTNVYWNNRMSFGNLLTFAVTET